jgi:hypothetical protein
MRGSSSCRLTADRIARLHLPPSRMDPCLTDHLSQTHPVLLNSAITQFNVAVAQSGRELVVLPTYNPYSESARIRNSTDSLIVDCSEHHVLC